MSRSNYLPDKSEWAFLKRISKEMSVFKSVGKEIELIGADHQRYLMILIRQILEDCPPSREKIIDWVTNDYLQFISENDFLHDSLGYKSRRRLITADLKDLERKPRQYLNIYRASTWEKKFRVTTQAEHRGAAIYQISGRGVIAYELSLTLPILTICLAGHKTGFGLADFFLHFGILNRDQRYIWSRKYFDSGKFIVNRFHEYVLGEISEILKGNECLFWQMVSPQVLLLREFSGLRQIIEVNNREIKVDEQQEKKSQRPPKYEDQWDRYARLTDSNYRTAIAISSEFCESVIESFIYPNWIKLGFSKNELEKYAPPQPF